jgi:trafficking protein particle complex subunit 2
MEDVAVYGYVTPLKVKIVLALALTDTVVKDAEVTTVSSPLHMHVACLTPGGYVDLQGSSHGILQRNLEPVPSAGPEPD